MVQKTFQQNGHRKRGEITPRGRRHQVESRLSHGIKYQSPVLPRVASQRIWETHLAGVRQSLSPIGTFEEALVHKIAFQLWRTDRLIRYETSLIKRGIDDSDPIFGRAARELIPSEQDVVRLGVYERQIMSSLKQYCNLLERAQALRLGHPVAAPIALDLTLSPGTPQLPE